MELFSDPEILEDRYDQVLQSALVEAVAHPTREVTPIDQVEGLMNELVEVSRDSKVVQNRSLRDSGRSLVFSSKGISGSALLVADRLLHLSAHKRCWGSGRPFADQVEDLARCRANWGEVWPGPCTTTRAGVSKTQEALWFIREFAGPGRYTHGRRPGLPQKCPCFWSR